MCAWWRRQVMYTYYIDTYIQADQEHRECKFRNPPNQMNRRIPTQTKQPCMQATPRCPIHAPAAMNVAEGAAHLPQLGGIALVRKHEGCRHRVDVNAVTEPPLAHRAQPDELVPVGCQQQVLRHRRCHPAILHAHRRVAPLPAGACTRAEPCIATDPTQRPLRRASATAKNPHTPKQRTHSAGGSFTRHTLHRHQAS